MSTDIPKHVWIAISSWVSKLIIIGIQFYSIRILIHILGVEGYASFTVVISLMSWFLLVDFGIGSSLQNKISAVRGQGGSYTSYVFLMICFLVVISLIIFCLITTVSEPVAIFLFKNFTFLPIESRVNTFNILSILFIMNAFGQVIIKILFAEQQGWVSNVILGAGAVLALFSLWVLEGKARSENDLLYSVYSYQLPTVIIIFSVLIIKLANTRKKIALSKPVFIECIKIIKNGYGFFLFSFLSTCVLQVDYLVLSQKVVGEQLTVYSIFSRIFGIVLFFYSALLQASWPVCSENYAKGNHHIYGTIQKKFITFGSIFVLVCGILVWHCRDLIFNILAPRENLKIHFSLIILFVLYQLIRIWTDTYAMFLQSAGILKPLWLMVPLQALISVFFQWYGSEYYNLNGLLIGIISSFLLTVSWWLPYSFKKLVLHK